MSREEQKQLNITPEQFWEYDYVKLTNSPTSCEWGGLNTFLDKQGLQLSTIQFQLYWYSL